MESREYQVVVKNVHLPDTRKVYQLRSLCRHQKVEQSLGAKLKALPHCRKPVVSYGEPDAKALKALSSSRRERESGCGMWRRVRFGRKMFLRHIPFLGHCFGTSAAWLTHLTECRSNIRYYHANVVNRKSQVRAMHWACIFHPKN
jgi:hypothetical protein